MRFLALSFLLLGRHVAAERRAARDHRLGGFAVPRGAFELVGDLAVVLEIEPGEAIEDGVDRFRRGTGAVGVFDTQQIFAAHSLGEQPVKQRSSRAANMEVACRRGGETCDDAHRGEHRVVKARAW